MVWTTPRDWTDGEIVTASIMNTHVRDELNYLKTHTDTADTAAIRLWSDFATYINVGVAETQLGPYTVPGGTLSTDGQLLRVTWTGQYANTANTKTWKFIYGGTSSTILAAAIAGINGWIVEATIMRTSATTQKIAYKFLRDGGGITPIVRYFTTSETLSGGVLLTLSGQSSAASNDIIQETFSIVRE